MKTITLRDEVYDNLVLLKQNNDSFSDVIARQIEKKSTDLEQFFGVLENSPVLDEIETYVKDSRHGTRTRI